MPQTAPSRPRLVRRTQRERRETSYRRMLDAAVKLIERQGSSRTTLAQIGELSGYSYGLVTHRFGSKEALVRAVTREAQTNFARHEMGDVERRQGLAALVMLVERYLRAAASRSRNALFVLIGEALGPVPEIRRDMAAADANFRGAVRKLIEQGIEAGEIRRDADPDAQAAMIVGTLRGLAIQRFLDPSAFDLEAVCRALRGNVIRSLAARARRKGNRADA
ncbi:MAG: TetR/AcrR family transcriptional regulator [Candidatus Binataceae bacterium]